MPEYRRSHIDGGTYFFTVGTFNRQPILLDQATRHILHAAWETVQTISIASGPYPNWTATTR